MTHDDKLPSDDVELRREATRRLELDGPSDVSTKAETARLVHELQVHQIELEMQNEELRESRDEVEHLLGRFTDLYDFAPVGYMSLDREGTVTQVNLTGAQLFGLERSLLVRRRFALFLRPLDRRRFTDLLEQLFTTSTRGGIEVTLPHADAPAVVLRIDLSLSTDGSECRAVLIDVSARRRADESVRVQSAALNAAANSIVIADRLGAITSTNLAFTAMTGFTESEASGRNLWDFGSDAEAGDDALRAERDAVLGGGSWHGESRRRRKDGDSYFEERAVTPVRDSAGVVTHFVSIGRDLTDQRLLEEQFMQAQKMETIGRLAGGIAHDFNNLLTVINGTTGVVLSDLEADDPLRADLLAIGAAGERAALLTRQLLAFSRKQVMQFDAVNPAVLLGEMRSTLPRLIGEEVELVVLIPDQVGTIIADTAQLEQVVMNLAVNASDAMPNGGTLTIEACNVEFDAAYAALHPTAKAGPHVMLSVRDTGEGMDAETRARVFEPFFTTKPLGRGAGLGLSTVYGIVRQSGASIQVESTVGGGSTFTIFFPRVEDAVADSPAAPDHTIEQGTERILLVEDQVLVCRIASRVLQKAGYTVLTANNGAEALEVLAQHPGEIDLLFTDIVMPGMTGWNLVDAIKSKRSDMKVLYTSGYTPDATTPDGRLDPSAHFLPKPYTPTQLRQKVREALDAKKG